jgi:excisionase family DNA binding protein
MMQDRFLTLREVREIFALSRSTIWRWTAEHGLKVTRIGSIVRIKESDLQAFLKKHETNVVQEGSVEVPTVHQR